MLWPNIRGDSLHSPCFQGIWTGHISIFTFENSEIVLNNNWNGLNIINENTQNSKIYKQKNAGLGI